MKNIFFLFILCALLHKDLFPQRFNDSLDFTLNKFEPALLNTKYDKLLNIYYLNNNFRYTDSLGKLYFNVNEIFNSTVVKTNNKNIRDEHYFVFKTEYNLHDLFTPGLYANSNIFSDDRRIEINKTSSSNAAFYLKILPWQNISVTPFTGYVTNTQVGETDNGLLYGVEAFADNISIGNINILGDIKYRNEDIFPRRNLLRNAALLVSNVFNEDVTNNIGIRYYQGRRDFYYSAEQSIRSAYNIVNNLQSRTETGYTAEEKLTYKNFLSSIHLDVAGRLNYRSIDRDTRYKPVNVNNSTPFDTKVNELKLEFESTALYNSNIFNGYLKVNLSERDEKHLTKNFLNTPNVFFEERSVQEAAKNNNSVLASISFTGNLNITSKDKLLLSFYQNKLRYDTPSEENYDDRDELLSIGRLRYTHQLTPFFEAFVNLEGTFNHIVYISSQTSSNNNINRVLRLASGGSYKGKNVSSLNSFEVSANYTVYDFEDINPNYRSFSFRQFTALDSSTVKLSHDYFLSFYGYLKLSEQGELRWASFTSRPIRYLYELYAEPKVNLLFAEFVFSAGMKYFELNTYTYQAATKVPDTRYSSIGPVAEANYRSNPLFLRFFFWYEFITGTNAVNREQINLSLQTNWYF